ncbi:hypothetical protein HQ563_08740 [bacterium]|nr:hypothetical protein [bacterium]
MATLITKRNITILNLVLLGVFLITLIAVGIPFVKKEPTPSLYSTKPRSKPRENPQPSEPQEIYVCSRHPEETSNSPGKCPQCDSELKKLDRFAAIVKTDLFNAHLRPPKEVVIPAPPPLKLELVGVTKMPDGYVAIIRDKSKRVGRGFKEPMVRVGEELPGYFGVTIVSIDPGPPALVKYERAGVGTEELKMGETSLAATGPQKDQWAEIIRPVRKDYTYVVKYQELQGRIPSAEDYRGTFGLEPITEGTLVKGLKITSLPRDNLLYAAGLRQGDAIESINGTPINDEASAFNLLRSAAANGFSIQLGITRGRTKRTIVYTLLKK